MTDLTVTDETPISDLRKAYEKLRDEKKTMETELNGFRKEKRTSSVADILKDLRAPAGAARFYSGEVDKAEVAAWLKENSDLFPVTEAAPAGESQTATAVDPNVTAARAVTSATANSAGEAEPLRDGTGRFLGDPSELTQLLRNTPRSPEGYQALVKLGLMPSDPNQI